MVYRPLERGRALLGDGAGFLLVLSVLIGKSSAAQMPVSADVRRLALGGASVVDLHDAPASLGNPAGIARQQAGSLVVPAVGLAWADREDGIDAARQVEEHLESLARLSQPIRPWDRGKVLAEIDRLERALNTLSVATAVAAATGAVAVTAPGSVVGPLRLVYRAEWLLAARGRYAAEDRAYLQTARSTIALLGVLPPRPTEPSVQSTVAWRGALIETLALGSARRFGPLAVGVDLLHRRVRTIDDVRYADELEFDPDAGRRDHDDWDLSLGALVALSGRWSLGAVVLNLRDREYSSARGNALVLERSVDMSLSYQGDGWRAGISGSPLAFDPLPGFLDEQQHVGFGLETDIGQSLRVRVGGAMNVASDDVFGDRLTTGLGWAGRRLRGDIAIALGDGEYALGVSTATFW